MSLFAANHWLEQRGKFESHLIASFEIGLSVGTTELVHSVCNLTVIFLKTEDIFS